MHKNRIHTRLLGILILTSAFLAPMANCSNHVRIAVIGNIPRIDINQAPQELVNEVIRFWQKELAQVLPDQPDLILLTEACDRPAGMPTDKQFDYFRTRKDQVKDFFSSVAKENHCYIAFGMKRQDDEGIWYNSLLVLDRNGKVAGIYNKNFPTVAEMESGIRAGSEAPLIECDFGTVAGAICFDLNFPEMLERYERSRPDIILFSSMYHGGLMQKYWAYASRSFFAGSVGGSSTPSEIRNPLGEVLASSTNYFDYVVADVNLDRRLVHLDYNWEKLAQLKKKYGKGVTIYDPGEVGVVMITSESNDVNVDQMIEEFGIEDLDDYFDRSRRSRLMPGHMK